MTCNNRDCESCNPLYYCEEHDYHYRYYEECWQCEDDETDKIGE